MRIGIAVLCRVSSHRLQGKILKIVEGCSVLEHILRRIKVGAPDYEIAVATSIEPSDDPLAAECQRLGMACFRGSLEDVAGRILACAQFYDWDFVVRINGDNLFVDPQTLRSMLEIATSDAYDFISNVPGRSFPYGVSVEILRTSTFQDLLGRMDGSGHREHVTSWLYENPTACRMHVFKNESLPAARGLQLAVDTEDDMDRSRYIMKKLGAHPEEQSLCEVIRLALEWNSLHG